MNVSGPVVTGTDHLWLLPLIWIIQLNGNCLTFYLLLNLSLFRVLFKIWLLIHSIKMYWAITSGSIAKWLTQNKEVLLGILYFPLFFMQFVFVHFDNVQPKKTMVNIEKKNEGAEGV